MKEYKPKSRDEIILSALEREYERLKKIADQAKKQKNEYMNVHTRLFEIRKEGSEIVSGKVNKAGLARLDELAKIEKKCLAISKADLLKLLDKSFAAEWECKDCLGVLNDHRFMMGLRKGR